MSEPKGDRTGWDRLESLFAKATGIPVEQRPAFLDAECAGNAELRRELDELLACSDQAAGFFDRFRNAIGDAQPELNDPLAGTQVGHYRLETRLGAGGMGVVYRAFDQQLQRSVALKLLSGHLADDPHSRQRFLTEARSAAALDHPNICTIHETGETESGQPFIAMAFCAGETLKSRIARGPVPIEEAAEIALQMARGLAAAHARGIVHRDIKPANAMIGDDGLVKLVDFGLARLSDGAVTESGMARGTFAYMAPELLHGERAEARSDLWSLGVVSYELLTGVRPFRADSDAALLYTIVNEDPPSIADLRPAVPEPLRRIADRLLQKDADKRYSDARTVMSELESFLGNAVQTQSPRRTRLGRLRGQKRQWKRSGSMAAVAIAAVAILSLLNLRDREPAATKSSGSLPRVAVMYFVDDPQDSVAAAVAVAVSRKLIEALSAVPGLDVPSVNAMQPYRDRRIRISMVANGLAAGWLVGGQVMRSGNRLEIHGELTDSTERGLDSRRIEGSVAEQSVLLEETVEAIAVMLRVRIGDILRERRWREGTASAPARGFLGTAMRHLQDANQLVERTQPNETFVDLYKADSALARAAQFDPRWPEPLIERAWLARRFAYQIFGLQLAVDSVRTALQRGITYTEEALTLGRDSARILEIRGVLRHAQSVLLGAADGVDRSAIYPIVERDLNLAVQGDSTLARALSTLGMIQFARGDFERARLNTERAYRADYYLAQPDILFRLFSASFEVGQDDEAKKWCTLFNRRFPNDWLGAQCRLALMTWRADEPANADTAWKLVTLAIPRTPPAIRPAAELQLKTLAAGVIARTVPGDSAARVLERTRALAEEDTRLSDNDRRELQRIEAGVRMRMNDTDGAVKLLKQYLQSVPSGRAQQTNSRIFKSLFNDPHLRNPDAN